MESKYESMTQFVVDRQIRPVVLYTNYLLYPKGTGKTIISYDNDDFNKILDFLNKFKCPIWFEYNGSNWMRSKHFHIKIFINPLSYLQNLWPVGIKNNKTIEKYLKNELKKRYNYELFKLFKYNEIYDSSHIKPLNKIHGYYFDLNIKREDFLNYLLNFETEINEEFKGYKIMIYKNQDSKYILYTIVDEDEYNKSTFNKLESDKYIYEECKKDNIKRHYWKSIKKSWKYNNNTKKYKNDIDRINEKFSINNKMI